MKVTITKSGFEYIINTEQDTFICENFKGLVLTLQMLFEGDGPGDIVYRFV